MIQLSNRRSKWVLIGSMSFEASKKSHSVTTKEFKVCLGLAGKIATTDDRTCNFLCLYDWKLLKNILNRTLVAECQSHFNTLKECQLFDTSSN